MEKRLLNNRITAAVGQAEEKAIRRRAGIASGARRSIYMRLLRCIRKDKISR